MLRVRILPSALGLLLISASASAEYFKCVEPDGSVTFQDCPCSGCPELGSNPSLIDPQEEAALLAGNPGLAEYVRRSRAGLLPWAPAPAGAEQAPSLSGSLGAGPSGLGIPQAFETHTASPQGIPQAFETHTASPQGIPWAGQAPAAPLGLARVATPAPALTPAEDYRIRPGETLDQHRDRLLAANGKGNAQGSTNPGNVAVWVPLVATAGAAMIGFLLHRLFTVRRRASNANELGRKWLAWTALCVTTAVLSRFFIRFDLNFLAQWALAMVVFGGLAYGLGWTYWKLVRESPWKPIANAMKADQDNRLYEVAWDEIQSDKLEKALWARSYAKCAGNQDKARALYVTERVRELKKSAAS